MSAVRPSGGGVFLRIYESIGQAVTAKLTLPQRFKSWRTTDGLEQPIGSAQPITGTIELPLRPFEIRGLRLDRG